MASSKRAFTETNKDIRQEHSAFPHREGIFALPQRGKHDFLPAPLVPSITQRQIQ
jgi:hypothetical protein